MHRPRFDPPLPLRSVPTAARLLLGVMLAAAGGCQSPAEPSGAGYLEIPAGAYDRAFDAVLAAVDEAGMPAILRDPRSGLIETEPAHAPSFLEPWVEDGADARQRWENTIALQQRRARIAFSRRDAPPVPPAPPSLEGPRLLTATSIDLTAEPEPLELRVQVFLERVHRPGLRRHTWSRRLTTRSEIVPAGSQAPLAASSWTVVARDHAFEQRLLARIEAALVSDEPPQAIAANGR